MERNTPPFGQKLGAVLLHRGGGGGGGRRGKGGENLRRKGGEGKKGRSHGERGRSQGEREGNLNFVTREKPWVSIVLQGQLYFLSKQEN